MALAHRLQKDFGVMPIVWTYVFPPTEGTLSSLIGMSGQVDFAVFVLGPDDLIKKSLTANPEGKGEVVQGETWTPRDNVIFEMGLLIGTLGKDRCFAVLPETRHLKYSDDRQRLHVFTDYLGTNYCTYMATKEPGLDALDAVFAACQEIGNQIEKLGPRPDNAFRAFFGSKAEAVVVYPYITAETKGMRVLEHHGGTRGFEPHYWLVKEEGERTEVANFDDLRAVNAIVELCGRMKVNVVATTDGLEQAEIQSLGTISFSIGLLNGLTSQAFEITGNDTRNAITVRHITHVTKEGDKERTKTSLVILFNGDRYPERESDLQLLSAVAHIGELPSEGTDLIIVADVNRVLHFRVFDADGKIVADTDEKTLTQRVQEIEKLKERIKGLWSPQQPPEADKSQIIAAVSAIVGPTVPGSGEPLRSSLRPEKEESAAGDADADVDRSSPNFAILVRTFLRQGGGPPILRFVCGGIEADGTAAAGAYLKYHWQELLNYYEEFGKDLEQDSLAVIVQFWGGKAESARPRAIRLCFFQPGHAEFHRYDDKTKRWMPTPGKAEPPYRPDEHALGSTLPSRPAGAGQKPAGQTGSPSGAPASAHEPAGQTGSPSGAPASASPAAGAKQASPKKLDGRRRH